jgi:hypothetical protein
MNRSVGESFGVELEVEDETSDILFPFDVLIVDAQRSLSLLSIVWRICIDSRLARRSADVYKMADVGRRLRAIWRARCRFRDFSIGPVRI